MTDQIDQGGSMSAECNRCYEASTSPHWAARAVTALREDHPCEHHAADHPAQVVPITQPAQPLTDAERAEVIDAGLHDEDILDMLGAIGSRLLDITDQPRHTRMAQRPRSRGCSVKRCITLGAPDLGKVLPVVEEERNASSCHTDLAAVIGQHGHPEEKGRCGSDVVCAHFAHTWSCALLRRIDQSRGLA